MKKTLIVLLMGLLPLLAVGQTRTNLNPKYGARVSSINRVTKVEVTDTTTNLYFHIEFIPGWYIVVSDKSYIRVGNDGPKLPMKSHQGIPVGLNANWTMPASGSADYMMSYPRVDDAAVAIDFIDEGSSGDGWNIYDIELNPRPAANPFPETLLGNWLKTDGSNEWVAGFFEKTVLFDADFWTYQAVSAQAGVVQVTLTNKTATKKLILTNGKNGRLTIAEEGKQPLVCSRTRQQEKGFRYPDEQLKPYNGKPGVAVLKGIIRPYTPKLGYAKGLLRVSDVITGKESELLVSVAGDGTFEVEVPLNHPVRCWMYDIGEIDQSVYLEPGINSLVYIDQESHIKFAVNYQQRLKATLNDLYMGSNAAVNATLLSTDSIRYSSGDVDIMLPMWVKLKRTGNELVPYWSTDGIEWKTVGQPTTVALGTNVLVGLCVTSHNNGAVCHANFSQVTVNGAVPALSAWKSADIGNVALGGKTKISKAGFMISGSGEDIWDKADAFRFVYLPLDGDGEITARVDGCNQTDNILKVGVMVRESLAPGAKYVMSAVSPEYFALAQVRNEADGYTSHFNTKINNLDMDLRQIGGYLDKIRKKEEKSLDELQKKAIVHPIGVQLARIRMRMIEVEGLLMYNDWRGYEKRNRANGQPLDSKGDPYQWLDAEKTAWVKQQINDPLSSYFNDYFSCIWAYAWYGIGRSRVGGNVPLPQLLNELATYPVTFNAQEKEWMDWVHNGSQNTSGRAVDSMATTRYDEVAKAFEKRYAGLLELAKSNVEFKNWIAPSDSVFGGSSQRVRDLLLLRAWINDVDYVYIPWYDEVMDVASTILTDQQLFESFRAFNEALKIQIAASKTKTGYTVCETPKAESDKLFDAIMEKYRGKLVYVDFWATWCSPCRNGIKNIAPLKEELKDKEVAFVYITGETSPLTTWQNSIPEIKGEHYRVSDDEWKMLKAKFNVTGIPHYVLVGKDGAVVNPDLPHQDNEGIRKMLFQYL